MHILISEPLEDFVYTLEFLHFVVQEEHLAAPVELVVDDASDFLLVEKYYLGLDRNAVGRGSVDDAQVPGAEQGELEGSRDGSCAQGECVDRRFDATELLLGANSELLLLVYYQKAQILEFKLFTQYLMGPY